MNPNHTAPKDGTMILAVFKYYPTPVAAMWNGCNSQWCAAIPHVEPVGGRWDDYYFEGEHYDDTELVGWYPLPAAA